MSAASTMASDLQIFQSDIVNIRMFCKIFLRYIANHAETAGHAQCISKRKIYHTISCEFELCNAAFWHYTALFVHKNEKVLQADEDAIVEGS